MTDLRKRMIECLQRRGLSERTQEMYVRAVRPLAEPSRTSPDVITEEELRQSFLYLTHVKQYSRSASTIALCGSTCFCEYTLHSDGTTRSVVRAPRAKKLPVILSLEAVRRMLGCVKRPSYRVCLATIYSCGLRLQEGTHLQVPHIDRSRMLVHVRRGQGGKDRDVPWPHRTLPRLREYWVTHRKPVLIFPAPGRGGIGVSTSTAAMPQSPLQGAVRETLTHSSIHTQASVHTLRHRWATHLLAAGVNRRRMQASLGHSAPTTPSLSTQLTVTAAALGSHAINRIMSALGWSRELTSSASMARTPELTLATGCSPLIFAPCTTVRRAAQRLLAARSLTATQAETTTTAPTPVRTGIVPTARMTKPQPGWKTRSVCCDPSLTSW